MADWDLALLETGNGGDLTIHGNDLAVVENDENEIYLRLFGGNIEADSKKTRLSGEQDFSYWANGVLFDNDPLISFNSLTERTLNNTPLTSAGRVLIQSAIAKDLEGLNVDVLVKILTDDRMNVVLTHRVKKTQAIFDLVRNPRNGDWDLTDFNPLDFF
jgi:hypothetical protein